MLIIGVEVNHNRTKSEIRAALNLVWHLVLLKYEFINVIFDNDLPPEADFTGSVGYKVITVQIPEKLPAKTLFSTSKKSAIFWFDFFDYYISKATVPLE